MHVLIHCDAGPALGFGHLVRSVALAEEALARGHRVTFAGRLEGSFVDAVLGPLPVQVREATAGLSEVVRSIRPDVVHLDTYAALEPVVGDALLSNIEDGPFGRRPADLVVDPNLGAEETSRPDVPTSMLLRGAAYVPLRSSVTSARGRWTHRDLATKVLVVMGGTDPLGLSPRVVASLADTGLPLEVTVVAPARLHEDCRRAASAAPGLDVEVVSQPEGFPALLVEQDLVVSAAGTTVWELCCLGVPMALVCAVDNQRAGYLRVVAAGAGVGLGEAPLDLGEATGTLRGVLLDAAARRDLADRASMLVDGRGAWRVVGGWEQLLSVVPDTEPGHTVETRPATVADAELLLAWRNDPGTRAASRSTESIALEAHQRWLQGSLDRQDRLLLVGLDEKGAVGTVRWDRQGERGWEVSITVAPERRGTSLARPLLAAGERALQAVAGLPVRCLAAVRAGNAPSRRVFMSSGYLLEAGIDDDGFELFAKQLEVAGRPTGP